MSYKNYLKIVPAFMLAGTLIFSGCAKTSTSTNNTTTTQSTNKTTSATKTTSNGTTTLNYQVSAMDLSSMFTSRDLEQEADTTDAVNVTLSNNATKVSKVNGSGNKSAVTIDNETNTITIKEAGVYVFSGTLSDGQIVVEAADTDKVQIVLDGVNITNDTSAAIYVKQADKTFITTTDGSKNTLETTGTFEADGETNVDGTIFSKDDLTINGKGTLTVKSTAHGIVSKDDLKVTGSTLNVTATSHALQGKDSIRIYDGTLNLTAGKDGLHSGNDEDKEKGYIYIEGGKLTINADDDGIHADTDLYIKNGTIDIKKSYEGLEGNTITIEDGKIDIVSSDDGMNAATSSDDTNEESQGMFKNGPNTDDPNASDDTAVLYINGGTITVNANGDGLDSNGSLTVTGGTVYVAGPSDNGNGALDVGGSATITGGTVIATGASGMAVNFGENSTQGSMLVSVSNT
ncbi:MAG: carbohydrate-binding domain-containing protein, partial [Lachnospiraceae bacterium]|nr:carbohydrate-binding domain-containing protein [Lachnospiraceae bacterium]